MDIEAVKRVYAGESCARTFPQDLYLHLTHGYVIVTPESILMGRPIRRDATYSQITDIKHKFTDPDCWMVWLAVGAHPRDFLRSVPYHLPFVAWERHNRIRFYDLTKFSARVHAQGRGELNGGQGSDGRPHTPSPNCRPGRPERGCLFFGACEQGHGPCEYDHGTQGIAGRSDLLTTRRSDAETGRLT